MFPYPCKQKTPTHCSSNPTAQPNSKFLLLHLNICKKGKKTHTHEPEFAQTEFVTTKSHKVMIFKYILLRAMSIFTFQRVRGFFLSLSSFPSARTQQEPEHI